MIITLMIVVFVLGYMAIALEHSIKIDKAASALIIGGLSWALFAFTGINHHDLTHEIQHHIVDIAEIHTPSQSAYTFLVLKNGSICNPKK